MRSNTLTRVSNNPGAVQLGRVNRLILNNLPNGWVLTKPQHSVPGGDV